MEDPQSCCRWRANRPVVSPPKTTATGDPNSLDKPREVWVATQTGAGNVPVVGQRRVCNSDFFPFIPFAAEGFTEGPT